MTARGTFEFLRQWRVHIEVAFTVAVLGGYYWLSQGDSVFLHDVENQATDWRFLARGYRPRPADIVIIGVSGTDFPSDPWTKEALREAPDLAYLTNDWPWNHGLWGHLTEKLFAVGIHNEIIDMAFFAPNPGDLECGPIFDRHADHLVITGLIDYVAEAVGTSLDKSQLRKIVQIRDPVDDLLPEKGPEIVGMANVIKDEDGVCRSLYHGFNIVLEKNPELATDPKFMAELKPDAVSMSWLAAQKALGHPPPLDPFKRMVINYYGQGTYGQGDYLRTIPVQEVLQNWDTSFKHGEFFRNKQVFIGATAERLKDVINTPYGLMPGVEVQATAFANLINGDWLRLAPTWLTPLLAILSGLFALFVSLRIHAVLGKMGLLLGFGVVFAVVTQWLFSHHTLIIPVTGTFLGLVVCGGFGTIYDFLLERYERRRMLGVFETMVSPGVASLVLDDREGFESRLGGQRRDVVILFSDIRGFTTWSEKVGPEALVTQLNEYFQGMVEVIQQEGGTVQKYIGDALMAAWGDVREQPLKECALQSVRAAWRMQEELAKLNAGWVGQAKREQLNFGIGINLGEGVVGRIGHTRRQEFTVMGDAVNLAARLESATKQYHLTILTGQQIYEHAKEEFDFRLADKMQVKGKTFAVPVYTPVGKKTGTPPPGLTEYEAAIAKYYARDFAGAAELFKSANAKMGGGDYLCENYLERCQDFIAEPPPSDWDGAWVLKDK